MAELKEQMLDFDGYSEDKAMLVFRALDSDQKGKLDFQDFLWAAMDIEKVLTPENIQIAFNIFAGIEQRGRNADFLTKDNLIDFFDA